MGKFLLGRDMPQSVLKVLETIGLPKHVHYARITIAVDAPIEIECTFYPEMPNGQPALDHDGFVKETKRFRIVEAD